MHQQYTKRIKNSKQYVNPSEKTGLVTKRDM